MAKLTLADITAITGNEASAISTINANWALIETALENTLSRDGTSPNTMTADIDLNSNKVINVADPTNNQDVVTLAYGNTNFGGGAVTLAQAAQTAAEAAQALAEAAQAAAETAQTGAETAETNAETAETAAELAQSLAEDARDAAQAAAAGIKWKDSCVAGTTANITLSGTQTIDGVSVLAGERVLVKDQTAQAENGIYVCAAGAWTRATPADTWDELSGAAVAVEEGTTNADTTWICTSDDGGTLGVTAVVWASFGTGDLRSTNNLSDLDNAATSRTNLGLGALAVLSTVDTAQIDDDAVDPTKAIAGANNQTGTTYTLALTDNLKTVWMNNASANTLTIPTNASVAFTTNETRIDIMMEGAGVTTITADTGVTLNGVSAGSGAVNAQYTGVTLWKRGTDTWIMTGNHATVA